MSWQNKMFPKKEELITIIKVVDLYEPAPVWQFTTVSNSCSRGSDAFLTPWAPGAHWCTGIFATKMLTHIKYFLI